MRRMSEAWERICLRSVNTALQDGGGVCFAFHPNRLAVYFIVSRTLLQRVLQMREIGLRRTADTYT